MDADERRLLEDALRTAMTAASGLALDQALRALGWADLLAEAPDEAVPLVFRLLGETGAQAPLINDVVLAEAGRDLGATVALPYAGGHWVLWERSDRPTGTLDAELPLLTVEGGGPVPLAAGRLALGWWLVGTGRAMLELARQHALQRVQFGRPVASFQAVRHRLAETFVAIEGAQATLEAASGGGDLSCLLAKAAAGHAALTAARHCQQVLGGMGFTAEHDLHRHVRRALVLDGLLGSARELTREAGALVRTRRPVPRLIQL